jgi:hypothetical protein
MKDYGGHRHEPWDGAVGAFGRFGRAVDQVAFDGG